MSNKRVNLKMNIDEIKQSFNYIDRNDNGNFKQVYDFISTLVLQSKIENIQKIVKKRFKEFCTISYNPVKIISKEKLLLNKLLNNKDCLFDIKTMICFNNSTTEIYYNIFVNNVYAGIDAKVLRHSFKIYKNPDKSKIINNYIDITNNYLDNIFSVTETIRDNIVNIKLDKKMLLDFIDSSKYKTQKNIGINLVKVFNDKLTILDLFTVNVNFNMPILDFINTTLNYMFIKSINRDLLSFNDKNIAYDKILNFEN